MCHLRRFATLAGLCLALLSLTACLTRRRLITRQGAKPDRTLATASKEQLLKRVSDLYASTQSFNATVDLTPAVGSVYKGEITEYKDVRAYILFRAPDSIRIIGQYPVIRGTAFDMTSSGPLFRLYIPSKNRFIEGREDSPLSKTNQLENLRPEAFLNAMLIRPPDPKTELPALEDFTDESNAFYILHIVGKNPDDSLMIKRNIWFDRLSLRIVRQEAFDAAGSILSDTRYSDWQSYGGIPFPAGIDINRPRDGYGVVVRVVKIEMNPKLTDDKFTLEQPEGSQLEVLGAAKSDKK